MSLPPTTNAPSDTPMVGGEDRFADEELPPQPRVSGERQWGFLRRPGWIASHVFAATVIVAMIALGFWQLDRLDQRRATNAQVAAHAEANPMSIAEALARPEAEREFTAITDTGAFVDP
ncbi:MAG: SURF1 family cytochrome oxidase biogenesis protein, partial [Acidimicrobiales bacterium]